VPLLRHDDALPTCPSRVTINGTSGAGKSTLAGRIGRVLDLPYTEMDSLFHGPGWTPNPHFVELVEEMTSGPRWVCEYQYDLARPMLSRRADLVVWLDLPTALAMWRVTGRTIARAVTGQELWNGNRETPLHEFFTDPEHVVRHAWATRQEARKRAHGLLSEHPRRPVVRLRSPCQVEHWLRGPLADAARTGRQPGLR